MLVKLRHDGHKTGQFSVDLLEQPSAIKVGPDGDEIYLEWNSTVDDSGHLRGCIACGGEVFRERTFPQITGIVVVLAFAGAVAGILGLVTTWPMLIAMGVVLAIDIGILTFSFTRLVCYECDTRYSKLNIAKYHEPWDADRSSQIKRSN
ncbi:MAG: hypothetical protein ISR75_01020 [Phycisphaerales bacterium]|nr:hypothetical protein [Planctomycetota bacterium]MBL6997005.1 hypothetical protein [Phycisphaerales bacterium]